MKGRQDITDLSMKVNSFADFLKQLYDVTLDQFNSVNKLYMRYKDLEDDAWEQKGAHYQLERAWAFYGVAQELFNSGYTTLSDKANGLEFTISPIMWIDNTDESFNFQGVIVKVYNLLEKEMEFIQQLSDLSRLEENTTVSIMKTLGVINRLTKSISQSTIDGSNLFNEMWSLIYQFLFNQDFSYEEDPKALFVMRKELLKLYYSSLKTHAKDCFRILLNDELRMYEIDDESKNESIYLEEYTAKANDEIAYLEESIAKLQSQIKFALNASNIIAKNNLEIAEATTKMAAIESDIQKLNSDEISAQVEIDALDVNSETYESDLAALQKAIAEIQAEKVTKMEFSSNIQADIAKMSAQNAELSEFVDQLDSLKEKLNDSEVNLKDVFVKLKDYTVRIEQNIARLERQRLYLAVDSNPWHYGGGQFANLTNRINSISKIADWSVSESGFKGVPPGANVTIPVIDLVYAEAFSELGFGDDLYNSFYFDGRPISVNGNNYSSIFDLVDGLFATKAEIINYPINHFDNFFSLISRNSELQVSLEKLNAEKEVVDKEYLEVTTSIDDLRLIMDELRSDIMKSEDSRNQVEQDMQVTIESIIRYNESMEKALAEIEQLSQKNADQVAQLAALDPESETYADDKAVLEASIAADQASIAQLTATVQSDTEAKAVAEANLNSLNEQSSIISNTLNKLYDTQAMDKEKLNSLESVKQKLESFLSDYDSNAASYEKDIKYFSEETQNSLKEYQKYMMELYSNKVNIENVIEDSVEQITIVKSKSNIRNNRAEGAKPADEKFRREDQA